jgi:hypothetical protein
MKTTGFDIEAARVAEGGPFENRATAPPDGRHPDPADGPRRHRPAAEVSDPADQPALEAVSARLDGRTGYAGKPGPIVIRQGYLLPGHPRRLEPPVACVHAVGRDRR